MRLRTFLASAMALMLAFSAASCGEDDVPNKQGYTKPAKTDTDKQDPEKQDPNKQDPGNQDPNKKDPVNHFFICLGQSNMEGNAAPIDKDKTCPANFQSYVCYAGQYDGKSYKVGDIRTATPPLCRAGQAGGVGVTDYFGRTLAGLVPEGDNVRVAVVALGGTSIDGFLAEYKDDYIKGAANWLQGYYKCYDNDPYARLIEVAEKAIDNGDVLEGILFHQGESDWNMPVAEWGKKVAQVYNNICKDLGAKDIPFIAGQTTAGDHAGINQLSQYIKNSYVIKSNGCENDKKGENGTVAPGENNSIHFNHAGYEEMGKRYAEKMAEILGLE